MRILAIGDIVGRPGRRAVGSLVPGLRRDLALDMVIANGENAAGGKGLTPETADELLQSGVDVLTSGNHIWAQRDIIPYLDGALPILRPLNYPPSVPGRGYLWWRRVLVVNLIGRTFMGHADCPFRAMDQLLACLEEKPAAIIVDFHAEATSEKNALGRYLDGRVSAVLGTHTHVGTADARILPRGTAFITDIGMVGPTDSVIGDSTEEVIRRFLTQLPHRLSVGKGPAIFNSVLLEIDESTARAVSVVRVDRQAE
ncbi:MAG: TIGR00282 family metallophosphoesterase [Chloroflexi bacterium]|nr:MAG: TIGR00282 family metallophosphoesterase [Chloroflexota bacterium]RLC96020.1 MAG: TIGR00282 family metallophosphoesterase [Chloroflexota bacterium]